MPKQTYQLEPNGPARLEISWAAFWKNISVKLDGEEIGTFSSQADFQTGKRFDLPDGKKLTVRLTKSFFGSDVQISYNGKPLPGTSAHPETRIRSSYMLLYFWGGLEVLFGLLMIFTTKNYSLSSFNMISTMLGLVYILLARMVQKRNLWALIASIVLFVGSAAYEALVATSAGQSPDMFRLLIQAFLVYYLYQGIGALKKEKEEGPDSQL